MDLDQSFLSELPLQHRQKVCMQIRQKQIERYLEFEKSDRGREQLKGKSREKRKGRSVQFHTNLLLQDALDSFNDREVLRLLNSGCQTTFTTGNGTSLLHRCAAEDNVTGAELLLSHGADVNVRDDDWWTPLHTACSCDSVEVLQFLLKKGADVTAMDVDGYFPLDQAPEGSEARTIVTRNMDKLGMSSEVLHQRRQTRQTELLNHIRALPLAVDVNLPTHDGGVTLLHIAAANGYPGCIKALFKYQADVNRLDHYGWSPLHVAARFNQLRSVELLLKKKANANLQDALGCKPSAYTSSEEIRALLMKYETKQEREPAPTYLELGEPEAVEEEGNVYHEISDTSHTAEEKPAGHVVGVYRINSKTVQRRSLTIAKEDEMLEAKQMYDAIMDPTVVEDWPAPPPPITMAEFCEEEADKGDYISMAIWKSGGQQQGKLVPCMDNDDLVRAGTQQEKDILKDIQQRYTAGQIYTFIGDILIAVNPFKELHCYAKDISLKYHSRQSALKLPPHIYGMAERSFCSLLREGRSQCHVISGESGSGKTETCKYLVQHLLRVAGSEETNLNNKINQVNPLLEAFGNAVTIMNNNSSRFGKYLELGFTAEGKVTGARICEYLLEKSRVVQQGPRELNFHIFYWMMAGLSPEEVKVFRLQDMHILRYVQLEGTGMEQVTSARENKAKFWEVKQCLKDIGFTSSDIQNVFMTLSSVLHLGEITFEGTGNNDAAQVKNKDMLTKVSDLLGVSAKELGSALVAEYTMTRGEQIKKERTVAQARDCRDALAKALYGRLFSWIVNGLNQLIQPPDNQGQDLQIGFLDIFGFEDFESNSFEQICINVANEQIQLFTNDHIFIQEQQDCLLEGVPMVDINFSSNQSTLDLFLEKHTGVFSIMDEESSFPKATDKSLATKLHQNTGKKHAQFYKTPKDGGLSFTVVHYAGSVTYDVRGVLEKNRDTLPNSVLYTMKSSSVLLLRELFKARVTRQGSLAPSARQRRSRRTTVKKPSSSPFDFFKKLKGNKEAKRPLTQVTVEKKGPSTVAYHFRNSLNDLVSKLNSASPHFVRCIKPNTTNTAMKFDLENVVAQLRYTGISDVIKIRKFGYAIRMTFHAFLTRYNLLASCCLPHFCPMTDLKKCEHLVNHYKLHDTKFGGSKVFLKLDGASRMDQLTVEEEKKLIMAQAVVRGFLGRQKSRRLASMQEEEHQRRLKESEISKITESIDVLEDVIGEYEKMFTEPPNIENKNKPEVLTLQTRLADHYTDDDDDDLYDDAFSLGVKQEVENVSAGEEMNGHMQRGLPPTPTHLHGLEGGRPPPCPREMYAQGMYASIEDQVDMRKQAPPPPRRNPETRLSTASVSSSSSATYEELHVEEAGTHHQHHQQQYHHHQQQHHHNNQNMSPRHIPTGSPQMRSEFSHEPQSPSHAAANRPFSYGAAVMSPKLKHTPQANGAAHMPNYNQNGQSQNPQVLYDYKYEETHTGSPAAAYGKHESAFYPQPHHPPPHDPPPPPPPGGHSQHDITPPRLPPQSPQMQRHSVSTLAGSPQRQRAPASPRMAHKLSLRSKSVPSNPNDEILMPPPPLSMRENYMATVVTSARPPSPPLPPPPPELLEMPRATRELPPLPGSLSAVPSSAAPGRHPGLPTHPAHPVPVPPVAVPSSYYPQAGPQAPPPPPINTIPGKKSEPPVNGGYPNSRGHNSSGPVINGGSGGTSATPPRTSREASREVSPTAAELMNAIGKVQLKKTGEISNLAEESREAITISGVKLRATSARLKLLEKDGLKPAPEEPSPPERELSPPPPPPLEEQAPPPEPALPQVQVSPTVNMFEKKVETIANSNNRKGDTSKNSNMSISIDDIDLSEVPGYTPITKSTPIWKRDMIEKKNEEKIEEYIKMKEREKEESKKWQNVPEWKRKLMMEKEREKTKMSEEDQIKAAEQEAARKKRAREAEEEKKARFKEQQEMQKKMEEELVSVPAWKREIMMKKGGAIKNWGDEREDINKQPGEEGYIPPENEDEENTAPVNTQEHNSEPQRTYTQKATLVMKPSVQEEPMPKQQPKQKQKKATVQKKEAPVKKKEAPVQKKEAPVQKKEAPASPPRQTQEEAKLEEEWDSLPLWKREILMKRGGAPSNWGDEREEVS